MQASLQQLNLYQRIMHKLKLFILIGELAIFTLRLLVQRLFSLYVAVVMLQILVCCVINFRRNCQLQSKIYILFNFILFYILSLNLIQVFSSNKDLFQIAYKDKFIINYVQIGYPLEFGFRFISMIIVWRIYQYSLFKSYSNNGERIVEQEDNNYVSQSPRRTEIRIRRNSIDSQIQRQRERVNVNANEMNMIGLSPQISRVTSIRSNNNNSSRINVNQAININNINNHQQQQNMNAIPHPQQNNLPEIRQTNPLQSNILLPRSNSINSINSINNLNNLSNFHNNINQNNNVNLNNIQFQTPRRQQRNEFNQHLY